MVEHAYADSGQGRIEAHLRFGAHLRAEIRDDGSEMPGGALPAGRAQPLCGTQAQLPEGGFGWHLIHQLTEELDYLRVDGRNHLSFTISLGD